MARFCLRGCLKLIGFKGLKLGCCDALIITVLIGPQTLLLARYMDVMVARQRLVAANVANVDTPGYQTRDVDFRREMVHAMDNPEAAVLAPVGAHHVEGLAVKNDGNNVHLDRELQNLAETGIRYSLAAQMLRGNIHAVMSAIHEGRR